MLPWLVSPTVRRFSDNGSHARFVTHKPKNAARRYIPLWIVKM